MKTWAFVCVPCLVCAAITSGVAIGGATLGNSWVSPEQAWGLPAALARWDGQDYKSIVTGGYDYNPKAGSRVAFFPAYPLTAHGVRRLMDLGDVSALVGVSNACLAGAFVVMGGYLLKRAAPRGLNGADPLQSYALSSAQSYALLSMGLLPTTFFFRMAYSESMFLATAIAAFFAMARRWPLVFIAIIIGFATAVRPVGIGLLLPFAWHVRTRSGSMWTAIRRLMLMVPIALWGLIAYMAFQYWRFGQPVAFALTQGNWRIRPSGTAADEILSLLSWQPIWSVYLPDAYGSWRTFGRLSNPLFNIQFANPIYFVGTAALVALGAWRRWLTAEEFLLSLALLAIPYLTRAYEMCMASQGRFAAVVFPVYIVIGELLSRLPMIVAVSILAFSAFLMAAYAALFAAGYPLI